MPFAFCISDCMRAGLSKSFFGGEKRVFFSQLIARKFLVIFTCFCLLNTGCSWLENLFGGGDDPPNQSNPGPAVCGDGEVEGEETCDDGDTDNGDGCNGSCNVESGWSCLGEPSECTQDPLEPECGNGVIEPGEACDDGDSDNGDGCDSSCSVESGWSCIGEPSQCTQDPQEPVCGNGIIEAGEFCDDGDTQNGDGCSSSCNVEDGWSCIGQPSQCTEDPPDPECGNGIIEQGETCDDGDSQSGDGCSNSCTIESGWTCSGEPSQCEEQNIDTNYIWISPEEIMQLPIGTPAWDAMVSRSQNSVSNSTFCNQDSPVNVNVLAKAFAVTRDPLNEDFSEYISEIRTSLMNLIDYNPPGSCETLAAGREIGAYVVAAQLIGFDNDGDEVQFRDWLNFILTANLSGKTLISTHEDRPNNWGTHAGFTVMAISLYNGLDAVFLHAKDVFQGWLGDRGVYAGFDYGELCWQANPNEPVGINPPNAMIEINGVDQIVDGGLPEELRRHNEDEGCIPVFPFPKEGYVYEALQGALAQAVVLDRQGFDVWNWSAQALRRAYIWLHTPHFEGNSTFHAEGDDRWQPYVVNHYYNENFTIPSGFQPGKNIGYTGWTHNP